MLSLPVQQDYSNDWIKRCLTIKSIDYPSLKNKSVCWMCNSGNPVALNAMKRIFSNLQLKLCEKTSAQENLVYLIWDFVNSHVVEEDLNSLNHEGNIIICVTDKKTLPESLSHCQNCKIIVLYCGFLYGAGFSDVVPAENDCTNIVDFFAAQIYLISKCSELNCGIYYAGHGDCNVNQYVKLSDVGLPPVISFDDGKYMLEFSKKKPDDFFFFDNTYNGKLQLLHQLLFQCLKEFDRICKKHDIKYFLGGGTLLGAVRHKGMIPWDDDMDVMMLRPDYENFLSVVNSELKDSMFFQSSKTDNQYHSIFTKIRLNDTLFVTKFSQQFSDMHQGIFIDIFVHDHTSDYKIMQKLHVFKTLFVRSMVFHKWANTPMHFYGKFKIVCKLVTKYINRVPVSKLENIQDKVIQKYNKKNTKHLYDGTGEHLKHGAFPAKWLENVRYADFNGCQFPIPEYAEEYLRYSYGNYEEWIPASLRKAGHDIIKVNFGPYDIKK